MIDKMNLHYSFTNPASVYDEEALTALELAGRQGVKINEVIDDQNKLRSETETHLNDQDKDIADKFAKQDALIESEFRQQDGKIAANHAELNANFSERFNIMNKRIDEKFTSQDGKIEEYHADIDAKHNSMYYTVSQSFKTQNDKISNMEDVVIPETVVEEVQKHIDEGTFNEQIDESLGGLKERVENLLGMVTEGSTSMDTEVIDARVDYAGKKRRNIGESIRGSDYYILNTALAMAKNIRDSQFINTHDHAERVEIEINKTEGVYLERNTGNEIDSGVNVSLVSDYIRLHDYPELYVKSSATYSTCMCAVYDSSKNFIATFGQHDYEVGSSFYGETINWGGEKILIDDIVSEYPGAMYVRFCGYVKSSTADPNTVLSIKKSVYKTKILEDVLRDKIDNSSNELFGKFLVCTGDSFTAGDFTGYVDSDGHTGVNSDAGYSTGDLVFTGDGFSVLNTEYKTYPYWVAKRNGMNLDNFSVCGKTAGYYEKDGSVVSEFTLVDIVDNYLHDEADYLLISYGLNDMYFCDLGTYESSDNNDKQTFYGALNYCFEKIREDYPLLKVGYIIQSAYLSDDYREAIIKMCKKWGIPYLDMKNDPTISTTLNKDGLCAKAKQILDNTYTVGNGNTHPNIEAHKVMSCAVEKFMRGL